MPTSTTTTDAPFHRLLTFYSRRNPHDPQTIRLQDSLRGNLALGLDLPAALAVALGRHVWLRNTPRWLSLDIHVPSLGGGWRVTPLDGVAPVDETRAYSCREVVGAARAQRGWFAALDALGLWALAADVGSGALAGADVLSFQRGTLFETLEARRRRGREQVLPLYRGGPISVAGHSWVVKRVFGVDVYSVDTRED